MNSRKRHKTNNILPIVSIFIMMILVAIFENVRGVFIPIFKKDFSINDTTIGIMLTFSSLGYIVFTYIGGILCEKIGQKKVFSLGFIFLIISLLVLSYTVPLLLIRHVHNEYGTFSNGHSYKYLSSCIIFKLPSYTDEYDSFLLWTRFNLCTEISRNYDI